MKPNLVLQTGLPVAFGFLNFQLPLKKKENSALHKSVLSALPIENIFFIEGERRI
jgi:hypothetical protein